MEHGQAAEVAVVWSESWSSGNVERRRPRCWLLPLAALMTVLVGAQAPSAHGPLHEELVVLPGAAAPGGASAPMAGPGSDTGGAVIDDGGGACVTVPSALPNTDLAPDPGGLIWTRADALAAVSGIGPNAELPRDPMGLRSSGTDPACVT